MIDGLKWATLRERCEGAATVATKAHMDAMGDLLSGVPADVQELMELTFMAGFLRGAQWHSQAHPELVEYIRS